MTVTFGFYNSVNGDRKYDAKDFAEIFDGIIEDGVHKEIGDEFIITPTGGSTVSVGTGRAWFDHTWTKSDTAVPFVIDEPHASLNRIDAIVLEINSSDAVRANQLVYLRGTPNAIPVRPALIKSETLNQYALGYIYRPLNGGAIVQANVTNVVGTPETPFAVSRLLDREVEPAAQRRNVFRGKFIGTSYSTAQQAAVANGTFEDLYVGDYWTINGMNWRIVDVNYYANTGDSPAALLNSRKPHLLVMPDMPIRFGAMNDDFFKANAGGYRGSSFRTVHLPALEALVWAAFPVARKFTWREYVSASMGPYPGGSVVNSGAWLDVSVDLPNVLMYSGTTIFQAHSVGGNIPSDIATESISQLALFRMMPNFIRVQNTEILLTNACWTRDLLSPAVWACTGISGGMSYHVSNGALGLRPVFGIS